MFIVSNLVAALAQVVDVGLTVLYWLILIRALVSWVNPDPGNPIVQLLTRTTEPLLSPIRRLLPPMAIDISPILAFLVIIFLQRFLVASLLEIAYRVR